MNKAFPREVAEQFAGVPFCASRLAARFASAFDTRFFLCGDIKSCQHSTEMFN